MENSGNTKIGTDELGKAIGILTAITLCLSVIFDWGYLEALGLSFTDVPTTIADHVRDALLWVPAILSAVLGYTLLELMSRRIEHGLTEEELINQSRSPKRTAWLRRSPHKLFKVLAITIILLNFFFGDVFAKGMVFAAPFMTLEIIGWSLAHKRVANGISPLLQRGISIVVPLTVFMYFFGYWRGTEQFIEKPAVSLTLSEPSQSSQVTLLRQIEKGILVKDIAGKAIFYRWEDVKSISTPVIAPIKRNRICQWFDTLCIESPRVY